MGKTFEVPLPVSGNYNQVTIQYLRKIDIVLPILKENKINKIGIEVRDMPEIMVLIEQMESSRQPPNNSPWQIHRISDEGITLVLWKLSTLEIKLFD